ncbi:TPA_exp: Uncharacterized protein A8136_1676 [Trichophyton benhamiae CBS 112371]|nr:TPA_exp: Uncharacterized protein A8136_1676 [Trichophyton benhamiae CBS 112371]
MDQLVYLIDPDGEVDIVLTNPDAPVAIFDENQFEQEGEAPEEEKAVIITQRANTSRATDDKSRAFSGFFQAFSIGLSRLQEHIEYQLAGERYDYGEGLSCEMLAKIALITDYYECKFVLAFFSEAWIRALADKKPSRYSRDMILWIWICWYFRLAKEFQRTTLITIVQSMGPIPSLGLPIPARIIDKLNESREWLIGNILKMLYERREILLNEIDFESRFGDVGNDVMGLNLDMFV